MLASQIGTSARKDAIAPFLAKPVASAKTRLMKPVDSRFSSKSPRPALLRRQSAAERFTGNSTKSPARCSRLASIASRISAFCRNEAFQMAM